MCECNSRNISERMNEFGLKIADTECRIADTEYRRQTHSAPYHCASTPSTSNVNYVDMKFVYVHQKVTSSTKTYDERVFQTYCNICKASHELRVI